MANNLGQQIKQETIDAALLTGPGEDLIPKFVAQMAKVSGFVKIFGPYKGENSNQQRWADYDRYDWSIMQLPAINIYEANTEDKESDQAFLRGSVNVKVYWPASFRRADMRRIEVAFKGAIQNFLSSAYAFTMLDEYFTHQRPEKVFGLNELGKTMTWTPNTEALLDSELVPVTFITINYRIDLRAWYRALEFSKRTKDNPFEETLEDLAQIGGFDDTYKSGYEGIDDERTVFVEIPERIPVNNGE